MDLRTKLFSLVVVVISLLGFALADAQPSDKYRLKPGATGKLCLQCHDKFQEKLKSKFVHTPVKNGECSECHNPHTSSHSKLLDDDPNKACFKCHEDVVPKNAKSSHQIAIKGSCVNCHDPHGSNNKANLTLAGNELCFSCHKNLGDTITKVKFKHHPVEEGCLNCHNPHASAKASHLLKNDLVPLCAECHKLESASFAKQHMNYPMAKANCSSCHNAHGSNQAGILYDNVHAPVASKACGQCHNAASSPDALKTKRAGFELCRGCHSNMMNETFGKNRIHWPLVDKVGCLNCHEPHASSQKTLLTADMKTLCGKCHVNTLDSQRKLAEKEKQEDAAGKGKVIKGALTHTPIQQGSCDACHSPHASEGDFLLRETTVIKLCANCHDWSKHTSHPMGEKISDSRNKNLTMQCLSCHISHGTGYRYLIPFPTVTDLCVQCHKQYKR